jgi:hypothetical protein
MILTTFKSVGKAYVDLHIDLPWNELAELLCEHHDVDVKEKTPMFNFAEFKSLDDPTHEEARAYDYDGDMRLETYRLIPNTVRRCKANVIALNGIVLDVDKSMTMNQVMEQLKDVEYVLYTTFRHTAENHRFRVIIPFSQPLLSQDIPLYQASIKEYFPGVDNASFSVSQSFYFHSGKNDSIAYHNKGIMIDPYVFERREPEPIPEPKLNPIELTAQQQTDYKRSIVESLLTCSGLHYHSEASEFGVMGLVTICKSIGLTYEEYDTICQRIMAPDSSLSQAILRRNAWTGWHGDKIRKEKRDAFIKAYNGVTPAEKNDWRNKRRLLADKYV